MVSYEGKYIDKIKGMGFRGILGALHLVFGVWLISTALWVLGKKEIFPWWGMDINIISSGILLAIGVSSLMIFFNFVKSANVHRILAIVNLALLAGFFLYLSQFLVSSEFNYLSMFFDKLYNYYSFGLATLSLFTLIVAIPNALTFFSKPVGEKKKGFLTATLLVLIVMFAALGAYYLYLNNQKNSMLFEEFGNIKLYKIEPDASWGSLFGMSSMYPYFIDSHSDTTGHPISKDTYEAMQFLKSKEGGKVLAWWDFELEIKAAGKEPVISYASEAIKLTIARPASLYDKFEPDEKVADVSRFFATDSEDVAKSIAAKYGADLVYISRQRMNDLIGVMVFTANPDFNAQNQDIKTPAYFEKTIKSTMGYRFNSGAEFKYFDKIFENKDVIIYQLKK
ncbi:MAG: hypothetical protein O8C64_05150 [Candidatus Methanoperedens sp.]|nr:hypothetical protein [Candidatus Methanoperedens sp.]MCZ7405590.1 hypothetical protein [Candidatus Methanoperedens sp.]